MQRTYSLQQLQKLEFEIYRDMERNHYKTSWHSRVAMRFYLEDYLDGYESFEELLKQLSVRTNWCQLQCFNFITKLNELKENKTN